MEDEGGKHAIGTPSAHLMAEAIQELFPETQFGITPIENGFYYDVDFGDNEIKESDLEKIEQLMMKFAQEKQAFKRKKYWQRRGSQIFCRQRAKAMKWSYWRS